jgi:WD40-like Beta Propeller Repeat
VNVPRASLAIAASLFLAAPLSAQLRALETDDLDLAYFPPASYLAPHLARCFENALRAHRKTFDYTPTERVTILLHDFKDFGNAGATSIPNNRILVAMEPFSYVFEMVRGNERMNWMMNHELVHIMASDKAAKRDRFYRKLFSGKVAPASEDPISFVYSYLTSPRLFAPRWYHEGIAVFMETWRTGGFGRALGAYDEMVFRAMVEENAPIYDLVGLQSAASRLDFQVGVTAYLYGTRFYSYMADQYGPEKIIQWVSRSDDSKPGYSAQFRKVFGLPLATAWSNWIGFERGFQQKNLEALRENPITPYHALSATALGSVSPAVVDGTSNTAYFGVNQPGQVAHLASLDLATGAMHKLIDIKGASLYSVTSLALDPVHRRLFYTTDNNDWRDLRSYDLASGRSRTLMKDCRIGDLAFDRADGSIWGVRHYNGISTLVRIPPPYTEWKQVYSWPYGSDMYDLDVAPDGTRLVAALTHISGAQSLITMDTAKLREGDFSFDVLSDFENSSPANFVFSPDGRYLYGSSYYSGVSNLYRLDLKTRDVDPLTNADTGYFRPVPLADGHLLAFRYTAQGFQPVLLETQPVENINTIRFLGEDVVERHPVLKDWKIPPPSTIDLPPLIRREGNYSPFATIGLRSLYPIVEGYKSYATFGLRSSLTDAIGYNKLALAASYSPTDALSGSEKLHFRAEYSYLNWKVNGTYNDADFYDLFGPTRVSRRGYSLGGSYQRYLIYDEPHRYLDYVLSATGYGNLERLPGAQNVAAPSSKLAVVSASLGYKYVHSSLGAVEPEKGTQWRLTALDNMSGGQHFPSLRLDFDVGVPLPISHSSVWLRTSLGNAWGRRSNSLANFYFGGFGNNWVDDKPYRRYQEYLSFPGVDIDAIGGRNYGKAMLEWNLPPVSFRHVGSPSFFANWLSFAVFTSGIVTDLDASEYRRKLADVGAQVDLRLVALSQHQFTVSVGYALAFERNRHRNHELMASLRIPLYE